MKTFNSEFLTGASSPEHFPEFSYPEIAFVGRSNVGKSSLLNSIVLRKNLAHISSTPGKTQQINFYMVDKKWVFADLPGFGYASVSKTEREKWSNLNLAYLRDRKNLKLVCQLVDGRHDPMELDLGITEYLENNLREFIIILTKCDKISKTLAQERKSQLQELISNCRFAVDVLPYSSVTNLGRDQLLAIIRKNI